MFKSWTLQNWLIGFITLILASTLSYAVEPTKHSAPNGKILVVMTNHSAYPDRKDTTGLWLTELTHFYDAALAAGYEMDFVSPQGGAVPLDERSLKAIYLTRIADKQLT